MSHVRLLCLLTGFEGRATNKRLSRAPEMIVEHIVAVRLADM